MRQGEMLGPRAPRAQMSAKREQLQSNITFSRLAARCGPDARGPSNHLSLLLVQLSTRIQIVKIQNCVEDQEVAAFSLATPHRVC